MFKGLDKGIIDAHVHLWDVEISGKTWLTSHWGLLVRTFDNIDLEKVCLPARVRRCVLVESGQDVDANGYLERISSKSEIIAAIIPWIDLESPNLKHEIEHWSLNPKFRGARVQVESLPDPGYLQRQTVLEGLSVLAAQGLVFEFLVRTSHLEQVSRIYERIPDLKGIIDHMAKPAIATGRGEKNWRHWIKEVSGIPNLFCKISGLFTQAGDYWTTELIKPYVQFVAEHFGFDRMIWGSDWPISLLNVDYATTLTAVREALGQIHPIDEDKIFRSNAKQFYNLSG